MSYDFPGDLLVFLALIFNVIAGVAFFLTARGNKSFEVLARKSYNYFTGIILLAFVYLYYLFFSHQFVIKYVYEYSDRSLPFFYLLSSFWGGQEGTYLLWITFSALFGYLILNRGGQYRNYAMAVYSAVNLFFLFIMVKLSPFAMLDFVPADGAGLNPLLQDPWMVIHPPVIFVGYAMAAVPFALAMAALLKNDYSTWVKQAFPWAVITTLTLAAGNILGGYWAYKTLGWGGFWAWDPVENSSFIPWFVSLAMIHGMIIERRSGALRKTNILMSAFCFILVIYGTFLTRSGVLADFSVHSFVDLGINQYLIGFLILYTVMTLAFFIPRIRSIENIPLNYNYYGKEFSLFAGMTLLFLFSVIVLFWTSLPFTTSVFTNEARAADLSTYNSFALPIAIIYALFLTVAPLLNYNSYTPDNWKNKLYMALFGSTLVGFGLFYFVLDAGLTFGIIFTLTVTGLIMFALKSDLLKQLKWSIGTFVLIIAISWILGVKNYLYILYFASAGLLITTNLVAMIGFLPGRWKLMGGQLSHFGFGLMLIGILGSAAYSVDERIVIPRGETEQAFGLDISYVGMENDIEFPHNKLILTYDDGSGIKEARPQLYYSERLDGIMKKPYVYKTLLYDLYFSPEQIQELNSGQGLSIMEGHSTTLGIYKFTFNGYEQGDNSSSNPGMTIIANITVESEGYVAQLEPIRVYDDDKIIDMPAEFGLNNEYSMQISQIQADQNLVTITIPGMMEIGPPDRLIMTIANKPIINFVWLGTTLILIGSIIVYIRRRSESLV